MPPMEAREPRGTETPGRLSKALLRLLMKRATVVATESLADGFRLLTLEGAAFKGVAWTPGQKMQVAMGSAFVARTYTPIEWDASAGRFCILAYAHGDGPGSAWTRAVEPGDECDVFGPRSSLDASRMTEPLVVFGDETSMGLAHALTSEHRNRSCACYFEVGDMESARRVMARLAIGDAALFPRRDGDAHLEEMEAVLPALASAGAAFILTGKAGTIQRLRQGLKRQAVAAARIIAKAYWAPGKTGLD